MTTLGSLFKSGFFSLFSNRDYFKLFWTNLKNSTGSAIRLSVPQEAASWIVDAHTAMPELNNTPINILNYTSTYGSMSLYELSILCALVKQKNPKLVFEFGTFQGSTTLQLAANSEASILTLDLPPESHASKKESAIDWLDLHPDKELGRKFKSSQYHEQITQLLGDSLEFDFAPWADKIDVVLIDACHHYKHVKSDTLNSLKMLRPDGFIFWHDCATYAEGVVQVVNEISKYESILLFRETSLALCQVKNPSQTLKALAQP